MSSYYKQIEVTPALMTGSKFPMMLEAVKDEASKQRWQGYSWQEKILAAPTFTHVLHVMGVVPIYEGNDMFTVDVNGTYDSSFFWPMLKCIAPFMNPGRIVVRVENRIEEYQFLDGQVHYHYQKYKREQD